jgi:hypothetical protein
MLERMILRAKAFDGIPLAKHLRRVRSAAV